MHYATKSMLLDAVRNLRVRFIILLGRHESAHMRCSSLSSGIWFCPWLRKTEAAIFPSVSLLRGKSSIWEFERFGSFEVGSEKRPLLVTTTKEFPFVDAVRRGHWEKFGVAVCRENGIEPDFSVRGLPPLGAKLAEGFKALVFALVPNTLIVRIQIAIGAGAKERGCANGTHA